MSGSVSMVDGHVDPDKGRMTPQEALNILDETVIGNLELKVVLSKALEKQIPKKPMTQFDRIKAMSIDEMAEYLLNKSFDACDITNFPVVDCDAGCDKCIRKWLESEVEEE